MSKTATFLSTMAASALCLTTLTAAEAGALGPKSGAYQAHVQVSCPGSCILNFPQIPATKVLQVGHVACNAVTSGQLYAAILTSTNTADAPLYLHPTLAAKTVYNFSTWVVSQNVQHYLSPLSKPKLSLGIDAAGNSVDCTLTGVLVTP